MANNVYDPNQDPEYLEYLQKLNAARENKPVYQSQYGQAVQGLYQQLQSRPQFRYDINADALYAQYRESYARQGRRAMEDTAARAQAMTGGYGSSYAQTAGQQAYQNHLGKLSDAIPQLYQQALERYQAQGSQLRQAYDRAREMEAADQATHKSALDAYHRELSQLQEQTDQAYQRGYRNWQDAYQRQQDAYNALVKLLQKGYRPTDAELEEAGMTREQANAFRK